MAIDYSQYQSRVKPISQQEFERKQSMRRDVTPQQEAAKKYFVDERQLRQRGQVRVGQRDRTSPKAIPQGEFRAAPEQNIIQRYATDLQKLQQQYSKKQYSPKATERLKGRVVSGAAGLGRTTLGAVQSVFYDPAQFVVQVAREPKKTLTEAARGVGTLIVSPEARQELGRQVQTKARQDPQFALGYGAGLVVAPVLEAKAIGVAGRLGRTVKVKTVSKVRGGEYVPPEKVFAKEVLEGKETVPKTISVGESLKKFRQTETPEGELVVQTSSPAKIAGEEVGLGRKGAVGLEDPGIYVTPKGEGSPAFLRIDEPSDAGYELTVNPLKGVFDQPTVTEVRVKQVKRLPEDVRARSGFEPVREFFQEGAESETAYITKRSEIGLGTTPKTDITVQEPFKLPQRALRAEVQGESRVFREGETVPAGAVIRTAGTSELEAVLPASSRIQQTGFRDYTFYKGEFVPIREARLLERETTTAMPRATSYLDSDLREVPTSQLRREQQSFSRLEGRRTPVSPISTTSGSRLFALSDFISRPRSIPRSAPTSLTSGVAPSAPTSMFRSTPSSTPRSVPPSVPPSAPPSVPPSVPTSAPPSVPPSAPPSVPQRATPSVPPATDSSVTPTPEPSKKRKQEQEDEDELEKERKQLFEFTVTNYIFNPAKRFAGNIKRLFGGGK